MTVLCLMSLLYTLHLPHTYRLRSAPPSATVRMRRPPPTLPWLLSLVAVLSPLRLSLLAPLVLCAKESLSPSFSYLSAISSLSILLQKGNAEMLSQGCLLARSALPVR